MNQTFADPTDTINSLIGKFTLSLITLAAAFLFYNMANKKNTTMPRFIAVTMAVVLLLLSISVSSIATYEFYNVIPKYKNCNNTNCLYTPQTLKNISIFYCSFSLIFILTNIFICYLLIKYHK